MSLRAEAAEKMAMAIHENRCETQGLTDFDVATAALDALCDYLTEHADEWKTASYETVADADPDVFGAAALAVLRESADV